MLTGENAALAGSYRPRDRRIPDSSWAYDDSSGTRLYWIRDSHRGAVRSVLLPQDTDPEQEVTMSLVRVAEGVAHVDLYRTDGDLTARLAVEVDDVWSIPRAGWAGTGMDLSVTVTRQDACLTAVAIDVTVQRTDGAPGTLVAFSLPHFSAATPEVEVYPYAAVTGDILSCDMLTNELTGGRWYRTVIDAGIPLPLAIPASDGEIMQDVRVGMRVSGYVKLTVLTGIWDGDDSGAGDIQRPAWWHHDIEAFAADAVVGRARGILGTVTDLQVIADADDSGCARLARQARVTATAHGTNENAVVVDLAHPLTGSHCSCPHFARGHFCKHLVATTMLIGQRTRGGWPGARSVSADNELVRRYLRAAGKD